MDKDLEQRLTIQGSVVQMHVFSDGIQHPVGLHFPY